MKELSIEEKARRYDEAIEIANNLHKDAVEMENNMTTKTCEIIFPELKDEDERIRKELISFFTERAKYTEDSTFNGLSSKEIIAWLEKQGEQKLEVDQHSLPVSNDSDLPTFDESIYHPGTEKTYEQKPTDKIEPKFKVGNKIKLAKEPEYPAREIIAIQNDAYYFDELVYLPFSRQDEWELVEQKPAETEKGTKGNNGEIPNSTWSEEDEKIFSDIIKDLVHPWNEYIPDRIEDEIKWLKNKLNSLRPQNRWKPSDEQIKTLEFIIKSIDDMLRAIGHIDNVTKPRLKEVLVALKKLREE